MKTDGFVPHQPVRYIVRGRGTRGYDLGEAGLEGLRRGYELLFERYGGLRPALIAMAAMLDTPTINTREGHRPDVAELLLEAAKKLP